VNAKEMDRLLRRHENLSLQGMNLRFAVLDIAEDLSAGRTSPSRAAQGLRDAAERYYREVGIPEANEIYERLVEIRSDILPVVDNHEDKFVRRDLNRALGNIGCLMDTLRRL